MLIGISPLVSPELLAALHRMGHGDEIVFADAHFPGHSLGPPVLRADGLPIAALLEGVMPLLALDQYVERPLAMMSAVEGDQLEPAVEARYLAAVRKSHPNALAPERIDRFAFYERAKSAFAVVMTGELAKYGNILVKKGVTPVA
ncbi:L-fucose mutarotase [Pelagicoccus sp. SDUM812003]|uniref:L-fucose mutarotase n=1 Tax=Pelagicoccus sp. SDUM812003 TaxID=3041267 RepID=UPI00280DB1DF|nr:L-fucose mutarotase [Pelagicoccus sp. SDUM812003]MDQ8203231.1 L-fucose mutarotase [Pelagicoccus sp. SDUM812003]